MTAAAKLPVERGGAITGLPAKVLLRFENALSLVRMTAPYSSHRLLMTWNANLASAGSTRS